MLRLTIVVVVRDTGSGGQAGSAELVTSLRRMEKVAPGAFVAFEFQQSALLRFQEQVAEGAKTVGAFVEAGMLPLDRRLYTRLHYGEPRDFTRAVDCIQGG